MINRHTECRFCTPCSWGIFTAFTCSVTPGTSVAHQSAWADCSPSFRGTGVSLHFLSHTEWKERQQICESLRDPCGDGCLPFRQICHPDQAKCSVSRHHHQHHHHHHHPHHHHPRRRHHHHHHQQHIIVVVIIIIIIINNNNIIVMMMIIIVVSSTITSWLSLDTVSWC